ncbi:hypothetical protein B0H66DRAFT_194556 [Apodospora peruviana]|uniref:Uncharacterized protein n=1 Tax=Apodospora peruviana TaxID=516989 RepID=A0AAE0M8U0_9PEZI|nr:hypothetical protein B0H66DRAFT_194556 [Apodospora peruviana]
MMKREIRKAILAIDLGSTAIRAALVDCETGAFQPVENREAEQLHIYNKGDFPNACCPFDDDVLDTLGDKALGMPRNLSAKYLMYLLADVDDNVMAQYPLSAELRQKRGDPAFLKICRTILVELLRRLKKRLDQVCETRALQYEHVVFTIPIQWEKPFQTQYTCIIKEAFGWQDKSLMDKIHFMSEADALAHYMIQHEMHQLDDWEVVLFLDFGGHSMAYSLFKLDRMGESISFIEIEADGVPGGGEMWSHHISELISQKLKDQGVDDTDEKRRWALTKQFGFQKSTMIKDLQAGNNRIIPLFYQEEDGRPIVIDLSAEEVMDCFHRGLAGPIELAREKLKLLWDQYGKDNNIGVVVAGGSLKTQQARDAVFKNCQISKKRVKYTSDMEFQWLSLCNCHGAGLAHTNKMTAHDFVDAGAAFAVQFLNNSMTNRTWEDSAKIILDKNGLREQTNWASKGNNAEVKIVCDPHFSQRARFRGQNIEEIEDVPIGDCYDLYHLGPTKAGVCTVKAELESQNDTLHLKVSMSTLFHWKKPNGKKKRNDWTVENLPLYFDNGHNCVHVEVDRMPEGTYEEQQQRQSNVPRPAGAAKSRRPTKASKASPTDVLGFAKEPAEPENANTPRRQSTRSTKGISRRLPNPSKQAVVTSGEEGSLDQSPENTSNISEVAENSSMSIDTTDTPSKIPAQAGISHAARGEKRDSMGKFLINSAQLAQATTNVGDQSKDTAPGPSSLVVGVESKISDGIHDKFTPMGFGLKMGLSDIPGRSGLASTRGMDRRGSKRNLAAFTEGGDPSAVAQKDSKKQRLPMPEKNADVVPEPPVTPDEIGAALILQAAATIPKFSTPITNTADASAAVSTKNTPPDQTASFTPEVAGAATNAQPSTSTSQPVKRFSVAETPRVSFRRATPEPTALCTPSVKMIFLTQRTQRLSNRTYPFDPTTPTFTAKNFKQAKEVTQSKNVIGTNGVTEAKKVIKAEEIAQSKDTTEVKVKTEVEEVTQVIAQTMQSSSPLSSPPSSPLSSVPGSQPQLPSSK